METQENDESEEEMLEAAFLEKNQDLLEDPPVQRGLFHFTKIHLYVGLTVVVALIITTIIAYIVLKLTMPSVSQIPLWSR